MPAGDPAMAEAIRTAAEIVDLALKPKPELMIHAGNLPATAETLRDLLAASEKFFDRGVPVRFVRSGQGVAPTAVPMTRNNVVMETHKLCQPVKLNAKGERVDATLPDRIAQMYIDMIGEWNLQPLAGISMSPLLSSDGSFRSVDGYDNETGLWCCTMPNLPVPAAPSEADARAALRLLRQAFRTFPFADAVRAGDPTLGIEVVDPSRPPGRDESAFLVALMTACCRSSLWLAPGFLLTAPAVSGAGSGKGLLVRAICSIAFGVTPSAFTTGADRQELEKRLAADLVEASPALFLDNANGFALRSDTLASVLTERPARVRLLGQTQMVLLNSTAFIAVTGNGLSVSEDLARRFIPCCLDARCEDPETRPFASGFLGRIEMQRPELLGAALTIWRWARQNAGSIAKGKPLGSFEIWSEWCRDPLLALGCSDPVERIEALKARDPRRQRIADLFNAWWEHHQSTPVRIRDLAEAVVGTLDAQGRSRQYVASTVASYVGTQMAGFVLTRLEAAKWTAANYALKQIEQSGIDHRGHRGHGVDTQQPEPFAVPVTPMTPMPYGGPADDEGAVPPGEEEKL